MKTKRRRIPLARETVAEGQHICYLYNDDFERRRVMAKYPESGLLEGEKVRYVELGGSFQEYREHMNRQQT